MVDVIRDNFKVTGGWLPCQSVKILFFSNRSNAKNKIIVTFVNCIVERTYEI